MVIVIISDIAGRVVNNLAGCVRERVPDGWSSSVFVNCTFDLVGRRCRAPQKPFGKLTTLGCLH